MNLISGLYFPGTGLKKDLFRSLSALFGKIDFYLLTEEEVENSTGDDSEKWDGRIIMPLGDDRERFMAMITDIRTNAAEYYESCLASLSAQSQGNRDESSVWRLVASLHGEQGAAKDDPDLIEKQWQARLVLKLAEIVDDEQEEIARELESLGQKEQDVFRSLKGGFEDQEEEAETFGESRALLKRSGSDQARARHLLAAWTMLFVNDPRHHGLIFTDNEDAAAALFNIWEEFSPIAPGLIAEIPIPDPGGRLENDPAWATMIGTLNSMMSGDGEPLSAEDLAVATRQWQQRAKEAGGSLLQFSLYQLQGGPQDRIWQKISGGLVANKTLGDRLSVGVVQPRTRIKDYL